MKFDVSGIFSPVLLIVGGGSLGPSLSAHGYQLVPIETNYLVGDNREFHVSGIF